MHTPWGQLPVSDAHIHFFSRGFFQSLAEQRQVAIEALEPLLNWRIPAGDPVRLAGEWVFELDSRGVDRAVLIASVPGDEESVIAACASFPDRFYCYAMVNPVAGGAPAAVAAALDTGRLHGLCFFPAMHCYSMHEPRVSALLDLASERRAIAFVHCGVLSVGVRRKLGLPSLFDMRYSSPLDIHAVALRYPQVRFVIPHFGAGFLREALMLCDLCPNVWLDTSSSNSWMRYERGLDLRGVFRSILEVTGPSRLLFGTDSSFFPRGWNTAIFEAQTTALYEIGADEAAARLILHDNLLRLFS